MALGENAKKESASAEELAKSLETAKGALKGLQDAADKDLFAKNPLAKARHEVKELETALRSLADAKKSANDALIKTSQDRTKDYREQQAIFAAQSAEAAKSKTLLGQGGEALAKGAGVVLSAAAAIAAATAGIVAAGVKYGIEQTAQREKQVAILDRLTKGQGAIAEEVAKSLGAATGVSADAAIEKVKGLINAKFNREGTELQFKASADVGAVKGQGAADAYLSVLEKVQLLGTASERSVKGLAAIGIEKGALYEGLRKTGETAAQVEARLKAGKVTAEEFSRAAAGAASKQFGGVAGKGLDDSVNRIKIAFDDLFDGLDLTPLDELGSKVESALTGKEGAELKQAINEIGKAALDAAKNVSSADIKSVFVSASEAARTLAEWIKIASDAARDLARFAKDTGIIGEAVDKAPRQVGKEIEEQNTGKTYKLKAAPVDEATATGKAIADGVAKGIDDNASKIADSAAKAVKGGVDAGNKAAGVKSPSVEGQRTGRFYDEGLERGIERDADRPAQAAAKMAGKVTRAGVPAAPGVASAGGGASGGKGDINISIPMQFTLAPGTPADVHAALEQASAIALATLRKEVPRIVRQLDRDNHEGAF